MLVAFTRRNGERKTVLPSGDSGHAVNMVGAFGGINASGNLLLHSGVDSIVDEVDIEAGGIGTGVDQVGYDTEIDSCLDLLDRRPFHVERARGLNFGTLLGLGDRKGWQNVRNKVLVL